MHSVLARAPVVRGLRVSTARKLNARVKRDAEIRTVANRVETVSRGPSCSVTRGFMEFSPQQITSRIDDPVKSPRRILVIDDDACVGAAVQANWGRRQCENDYHGVALLWRGLTRCSARVRRGDGRYLHAGTKRPRCHRAHPAGFIDPDHRHVGLQASQLGRPRPYLGLAAQRGATLCIRKPFNPQLIQAIEWTSSAGTIGTRDRYIDPDGENLGTLGS